MTTSLIEFFPGELGWVKWANGFHTGLVGSLTSFFYLAFEPIFAIFITIAVSALFARRSLGRFLCFGMTVAFTWLPIVLIKLVVHRPRPMDLPNPPGLSPTDWSFPSGHIAFVTALMVAVFIFTRNVWARAAAVAVVIIMSITVLVVGVHYPTDVAFSWIWSLLLGPVMFKLACLICTRLPGKFELTQIPSSSARNEHTYQQLTPRHRAQTQRQATERG